MNLHPTYTLPTPYLHPDCEKAVAMMTRNPLRTMFVVTAVQDVQDAKPLLGHFLDTLKSLIIKYL